MTPLPGSEPFSADGGPVGVLLSHGFTGMPSSMRPWGEYLAERGYTVRVPLLPGHGTSWQELNTKKWQEWYATLEQAYSELAARCDQVFLCGLSMGGTLVTRLAEQKGAAISGVVLVNPSYATERKDAPFAKYISWLITSKPAIASDIKRPGGTEQAYERTPVKAFVQLQRLWGVVRPDLGAITAPVLLLRSREDHVVEASSGAILQAGATGTTVREVVLENSYHVATLDNDAPLVFSESLSFIQSLTAAAPAGPGSE